MTLQTLSYVPREQCNQPDPTIGLSELRRGLWLVVLGYLAMIALLVGAGLGLWLAFSESAAASGSRAAAEDLEVILFAGAMVFLLLGLASIALVIRGKWVCLMHAPETFHAKWFMFGAIVCILTGPALNFGSSLIGEQPPNSARKSKAARVTAVIRRDYEEYKKGVPTLDTRGWTKVAGDIAGLLSSIFFVLFLRAVALCWGYQGRARFAELYLVFLAVLVAGIVVLLRNPTYMIHRPQLLLGLAGGWLLSGVWYFLLIIATISGLHAVRTR
jgi:hypothetical protein